MTFVERVGALVELGFRPRDVRFLTTVLLHGGFFVRRQYRAFARVNDHRVGRFLVVGSRIRRCDESRPSARSSLTCCPVGVHVPPCG